MPGAMPVLNGEAIDLAVRAAFALNTKPQKFSKFDRKHYFYPDLPKGYQITQFEDPIIKGGYVDINVDGNHTRINITRVHLEEDAGKNTHPDSADYSLVDLNRAGTPLLEIVSQPDIHSPAEAKAYARELYLLMKYADVSDVDLYHGNMRFDVNISVSVESDKLGKRAEIKNLNSFRSVENAVTYEIDRQIELYEHGKDMEQETRGWDEAKQKTISQRGKEESHDYRYMPEPDIPPLELDEKFINKIKSEMPVLPPQIREKFNKLSISPNVVEDILDRPEPQVHRILEAVDQTKPELARRITFNLIEDPQAVKINLPDHIKIVEMVELNQLSSTGAKEALRGLIEGKNFAEATEPFLQLSDEAEIEKIVSEVIAENQKIAEDIKNGELKAVGFLVGRVMAKSQGKANPQLAQEIIIKTLGL
jgi:aspartyl-tRNA(Asn)/glutamyl-tRNA(Gln) amidotransferase subunit B